MNKPIRLSAARFTRSRIVLLLAVVMALFADSPAPKAQGTATVNPDDILYIMPTLDGPNNNEIAQLRSRIGEGKYVRVGFSTYINVSMGSWTVDTTDRAAIRAQLSGTIAHV